MSNLNALRISDNARYDTANTTITIPYKFKEDVNTFIMLDSASVCRDKTMKGHWLHRNVWPNYTYKKYGDYSWKFDSLRGDYAHVLNCTSQGYYTPRTMDPRYDDWTVECWASWLNSDSGGYATTIGGAYGSCLFHISNDYYVGIVNGTKSYFLLHGTRSIIARHLCKHPFSVSNALLVDLDCRHCRSVVSWFYAN